MKQRYLGITAAILNLLDMLTTLYGVKVLGAVELNPLMNMALRSATFFCAIKIVFSIWLIALAFSNRNVSRALVIIVTLYSVIVASNFLQIIWI